VRIRGALAIVALAATVGGCGAARRTSQNVRGPVLSIYFSAPLHGASSPGARAALAGAGLAFDESGSRLGRFRLAFKVLDDSTPQSQGWDPSQTTINARQAAQDPTTIGYIGDFNSGASAIAIPLLNRQGIPQVSPGSTAIGLTRASPGAAPGEPEKYYPTVARTFARVVPTDASQALALVRVQQSSGCHSTFVLQDGEFDGEDAAISFLLAAQSAGLRVVGVQAFQRHALDYTSLATSVAKSGADCVLISSIDEPSSVRLTEQVARALPHALIFASNGLADSAYFDPGNGGIPVALDPRVILASATLGLDLYPASARVVLARYTRRFGTPEPPMLFGYVAMEVMLGAIRSATGNGHGSADRAKVVAALLSTREVRSPVGAFRIDRGGDTTERRFGVYRIASGRMSFLGAVG
jgi:branched-chain amino acid transport system substrate-binding protein